MCVVWQHFYHLYINDEANGAGLLLWVVCFPKQPLWNLSFGRIDDDDEICGTVY